MWFQGGVTVTFVKRSVTGTDDKGNDVYGETTVDVQFCAFDPGASTEVIQGTEQVIADVTVYAPPGTDVGAYDAFIVGGQEYEVQGTPNAYQSPFTGFSGPVTIRGKIVEGVSV
jgi:hypothetical protein